MKIVEFNCLENEFEDKKLNKGENSMRKSIDSYFIVKEVKDENGEWFEVIFRVNEDNTIDCFVGLEDDVLRFYWFAYMHDNKYWDGKRVWEYPNYVDEDAMVRFMNKYVKKNIKRIREYHKKDVFDGSYEDSQNYVSRYLLRGLGW